MILLFFLCYILYMFLNSLKIRLTKFTLITITLLIFQSCSSVTTKTEKLDINDVIYSKKQQHERRIAESGKNTLIRDMLLGKDSNTGNSIVSSLSVNPYLWKASLDIISSTMPLASVDSNSGIIISDWYNIKGKQNERVKISVLITSKDLRADGLKVSIFKQVQKSNSWNNIEINPRITLNLERKIIRKAAMLENTSN